MSDPLFTAREAQSLDQAAAAAGMPIDHLMEQAGQGAAALIAAHVQTQPILVLCGPGHNGGDGFVVARELKRAGWPVTVACLVSPDRLTGAASMAFERWEGPVFPFQDVPVHSGMLVVDAVFGTGFHGGLPETVVLLFDRLKKLGCYAIALDVPSGVDSDTGAVDPATLPAFLTLAFAAKKRGHVLMPGRLWCGVTRRIDIGIPQDMIVRHGGACVENASDNWRGLWPRPSALGHKYTRGTVTILAKGAMRGAVTLAGLAAARAGAGLVMLADGECADRYAPNDTACLVQERAGSFTQMLKDQRRRVFVMGSGFESRHARQMRQMVMTVMTHKDRLAVLDAGAVRAFAAYRSLIEGRLHAGIIMTPHEGEFTDLFPDLAGSKPDRAVAAAKKLGCIMVLKGPDTVVAHPDGRIAILGRASPYLATAGSGDVLVGIVAGLLAQGVAPFDAAGMGVSLHAALANDPDDGLIASDMIARIPAILAAWR